MKASASTRKPKTKRSEEIKKPSESIPVTEAKSKQTRKPDKDLIPKGESTVLDLRRFSETGFLAGTVKEKDWGSKLTKALALASQLEQVMNNDMCKDLAKTLTEEANGVSNAMDTVKVFRNMTPAVAARELIALSDEFLSRMARFPQDCLTSLLTDCGRKLLQEHVNILCLIRTVRFKTIYYIVTFM